jgi:hypothetical protein
VVATGTAPFTYQWQCNGVNITGATTSSYTKCPVALTDNGNSYRVVIGNPCGSATSADAVLTVVDTIPPVLHCPTSDIVVQGATPGAVVNYPIGAGDCSPNIVVVCAPPSGTIFPCGTTTVTCQASDPSGNSSTCSFRAIVLCDCLTLLNERLSCANGAMNYAFTLQNNSGVPVKNLFLVPKTNCFSVNPDVFTFKPLLATGQSTNLSTTINLTGGCSTNLCFLVVALNSNGVECCSVMHCVNRSLAAPRLTGASAACGGNKITATFNEPLDPASALNLANYIVDDFTHHLSLLVTSVAFGADSKTICLYTAATLAAGTQFRLTVNNVTDLCGNAIAPNTLLNFGCPSKLNMTFASGMLCMSWTGEAVLETTSSLTPPIAWAAAANQTNPQCILPSGPQKFFRIRGN